MTSSWRRPAALLILALAIRLLALAVAAVLGAFPEYWEPEVLARNVLDGRGYVYPELHTMYHAYMEPLYPGFVIGVYAASGRSERGNGKNSFSSAAETVSTCNS